MGLQGVGAVDRALSLLQAFREGDRVVSLAELARRTGFHKSTILRLLGSLEKFEFITRSPEGGYSIGLEPLRLSRLRAGTFDLEPVIRQMLADLVAATGETASFYVRRQDKRLCLYRLNSPRAIRHHLEEGALLPLDRGAAGRVISAWTSAEDNASRRIRAEGFCISRGERDTEVAAVAVPVLTAGGTFLGALSVSGLRSRLDEAFMKVSLDALRDHAQRLRRILPDEL